MLAMSGGDGDDGDDDDDDVDDDGDGCKRAITTRERRANARMR